MSSFVNGAIMLGFMMATLYFFKFWRTTKDRLFLYFSIAFALMCMNRVALVLTGDSELRLYIYMVRLFAFLLIIVAIVEKNFAQSRGKT